MPQHIIPREQVAQHFAVNTTLLVRYESRGLVQPVREGATEGYGPDEIRRLWSILSLQRDLGINLAGVEAILRLRTRMNTLQGELNRLASELEDLANAPGEEDADAER